MYCFLNTNYFFEMFMRSFKVLLGCWKPYQMTYKKQLVEMERVWMFTSCLPHNVRSSRVQKYSMTIVTMTLNMKDIDVEK